MHINSICVIALFVFVPERRKYVDGNNVPEMEVV